MTFAQVKLICVGEGNVGKSTLINTLASMSTQTSTRSGKNLLAKSPSKKDTNANLATDGIEISSFMLDGMTYSAWDFAGQDAYHVPHQLFLSSRAIYLVPFNLATGLGVGSLSEESFLSLPHIQSLRFWLASIAARVDQAEVLVIGTHADEPMIMSNPALVSFITNVVAKLQKQFPIVVGFHAVSLTKRIGIEELRKKLAEVSASPKLKIVKGLPVSEYLLVETVRRMRRRYAAAYTAPIMTWKDYEHLVLRHNVHPGRTKETAEFLASIGELGYFPEEDWSQKNVVFLDPQWVVNTMRTIFTLKHNLAKNGRIYNADLKLVWKPPEHPESIHATLLQLLEKFEVLYAHPLEAPDPNRGQCYLVPAFLPATGNAFSLLWPRIYAGVELGRLYKMQFLPTGFFSRLTIRLLHFVKVQGMWSDGIVISDKDASALVRIVPPFTLRVSVRSAAATPVRLLRLILNTIDTLLNYWYKVGVEKFVPCTHCVIAGLQPFMFPTGDCEEAAARGALLLTCVSGAKVRLDSLMPDLVMGDLKRALIDYKEITIQNQLGQGAFGIIHKGIYRGETVAVKLLKFEEDSRVQAFNEFRSEVILMSALTHPNVVGLRGYCSEPYAMVMECVQCGDLYRFIHDTTSEQSWRLKLRMALDIALGMRFLHSLTPPLIHRDLKSPNILLAAVAADAPVVAKVADFGLSTILFNNALREDAKSRAVANPTWLSPEVTKGNSYSEKSDVYAFGVIMHEIITRRHPFEEYNFKLLYLLEEAVQKGVRPSIAFQYEKEAPAFCQLIRDSWQNEPDKRPTFDQIALRLLEQIPQLAPGLVIPKVQYRHTESTANISEKAVVDGRLLQRLPTSLNASRSRIWAGTKDGAILMYSAENGEMLEEDPKAHPNEIRDMRMLRSFVFTAGVDGAIKVWQPKCLDNSAHLQQMQSKEGFLNKEGASNKTWQRRYFKLRTDFVLEYGKQPKDPQAKTIMLREAKLIRTEGERDKKYIVIGIQPASSTRVWHFRWKQEEKTEADEWINAFKKAILLSDPALEKQNMFVQVFNVEANAVSCITFEMEQFFACGPNYKIAYCPAREPTRPYKIDSIVTVVHPSLPSPAVAFSALYAHNNLLWAVANTVVVSLTSNLKPAARVLDVRTPITASVIVNGNIWTGDKLGNLRVWALDSAICLATVAAGVPGIACMTHTTWAIWCGSFDGNNIVIDVESREILKRPNKEHRGEVVRAITSYGRIVWTAGADQTMNVWVLTS